MTFKTIELIIDTDLTDTEVLDILNEGTTNLKELGMILHELKVKGSAISTIKGISYNNE